jgi:hypothetical protein
LETQEKTMTKPEDETTKQPSQTEAGSPFTPPGDEEILAIVQEFQLTREQANELDLVLRHAKEDIEGFLRTQAKRKPRAELVRRLKIVDKSFERLHTDLTRYCKTLGDVLPFDTLQASGELLSYGAIESALNRKIPGRNLLREIEEQFAGREDLRAAEIEELRAYERQALGLNEGPALIAYIVGALHRPIRAWLEIEKGNRGGRPADLPRLVLLIGLAKAAPDILGAKPTATANGRFMRLCAAVCQAYGFDNSGIEEAVERLLRKRNDKRKRARNPPPEPKSAAALQAEETVSISDPKVE